ncbi:MAG: F0F1 ATP synthase subunit epsilon [Atribacterota bacterium]|jgi:F-type H+-transporting ATPase subunit epsilon|nr:F0F1 ATP synthase subunit epsilon [Atribacterota bacterium]
MIELRVLLPEKTYWHGAVKKIIGESTDGFFCLLTRHVDFVTIMTPGIFFILTEKDEEVYIAINEGILIKINKKVTLSTRGAIKGDNLGNLKKEVEENFLKVNEQEKGARIALQKLEADFVRRFLDLEAHG